MIREANVSDIQFIIDITKSFAKNDEQSVMEVLDNENIMVYVDRTEGTLASVAVNYEAEFNEVIWFLPQTKSVQKLQPVVIAAFRAIKREHPSAVNWNTGGIFTAGRGCLIDNPKNATQITNEWNGAFRNSLIVNDLPLARRVIRGILSTDDVKEIYGTNINDMIAKARFK